MVQNEYLEQLGIYEISKEKIFGKILDVSNGSFMSYYGAKLILQHGADEVWNIDNFKKNIFSKRQLGNNREIQFDRLSRETSNSESKIFDGIISINVIKNIDTFSKEIQHYYNIIKENGFIIVSIPNKNRSHKFNEELESNIEGISFDELQSSLQKMPKYDIFSQVLSQEANSKIFSPLRRWFFRKIIDNFLKGGKRTRLLNFEVQDLILDSTKKWHDIKDKSEIKKYTPIPFQKTHNPLNFVVTLEK